MGLFDFFKNKKTESNTDFTARMREKEQRRDLLYDGQRPNEPDYGYSLSNPIMTSAISTTSTYLERLRTKDGKKFTWNRIGSFCTEQLHGIEGVIVDKYMLFVDGEEFKTIYICPYGHDSEYAPSEILLGK